jgi:hypothetical protein
MNVVFVALCLLAIGAWLSYAYRQGASLLWLERVALVLGGGVAAALIAWVVAFAWDGVPATTSGVDEVARGVLPIAGGFGCLSVCLLIYRAARRRRHEAERHPTRACSG